MDYAFTRTAQEGTSTGFPRAGSQQRDALWAPALASLAASAGLLSSVTAFFAVYLTVSIMPKSGVMVKGVAGEIPGRFTK